MLKKQVLIGIPAGNNARQGPIGNAALGYIMEHGSPVNNIPARPFLVPGVRAVEKQCAEYLKQAMRKSITETEDKALAELTKAGLTAQNSVQDRIRSNIPPPLKPATTAARRRRGHQGSTALIDTGALLQSITFVIRAKGGK